MSVDEKTRAPESRGLVGRLARGLAHALVPTERTILTREGWCYFGGDGGAAGHGPLPAGEPDPPGLDPGRRPVPDLVDRQPGVPAAIERGPPGTPLRVLGRSTGRRLHARERPAVDRRAGPVHGGFAGPDGPRGGGLGPLAPRLLSPSSRQRPRPDAVAGHRAPGEEAYRFRDLALGTRAPFGLIERRVTIPLDEEIVVYPRIGQLTRRWFQLQRQASENRMGKRHDRSSQQEEYHGLRDYRSGDSPRWIHWRTSARRGELMVKEFEQQNEQELALLIDPWLPRTKVAPELREAMEQAISFAATVCLESCRRPGRRLVLGWTGATPGICQGQASVKLLHELLEQLAVLRPATEGTLAELIDALPATALRDSLLIIVSTRPLQLAEEAERSKRLAGTTARTLLARAIVLNAAQGELSELIQDAGSSSRNLLEQRVSSSRSGTAHHPGTAPPRLLLGR